MVGASVHVTHDLPFPSDVVDVSETDPPPSADQVRSTPETPAPFASTTSTTSAESSGVETSPDCPEPETTRMLRGECAPGKVSEQEATATAVATNAMRAAETKRLSAELRPEVRSAEERSENGMRILCWNDVWRIRRREAGFRYGVIGIV